MSNAAVREIIPSLPSEHDVDLARASSRQIAAIIGRGKAARLRAIDGGHDVTVPLVALRLLERILTEMGEGNAVTVVPHHAELTTQQAADFLNVSRPFLVNELEQGRIPFRRVGKHRRVLFKDLVTYRAAMNQGRDEALDELATMTQEFDLPDGPPTNLKRARRQGR